MSSNMFLPVEANANLDLMKIVCIRQTIFKVNMKCTPRPQRLIPHFTPKTYELLNQLRKKMPDYSLQES
jgi:hypothetical protein